MVAAGGVIVYGIYSFRCYQHQQKLSRKLQSYKFTANQYIETKQYQRAIQLLTKMIQLEDNNYKFYNKRANLYFICGQ
jgi:tetratricopeptide (TPR) repeat protein